ncbi:hypothetical protein FGB62_225g06 [Gracilaria domingensis]|nr:hypothetical protein FGB62_225g06 [Gracilaria domingensis]
MRRRAGGFGRASRGDARKQEGQRGQRGGADAWTEGSGREEGGADGGAEGVEPYDALAAGRSGDGLGAVQVTEKARRAALASLVPQAQVRSVTRLQLQFVTTICSVQFWLHQALVCHICASA